MDYIGLDDFLLSALKEDIGTGDITTISCIPAEAVSRGRFIAKQEGIVCGTQVAKRVFALLDSSIDMKILIQDGEKAEKGSIIAEISGSSVNILSGERVALNLMQRMSGIATRTRQSVDAVAGTGARIVDTRKSTPGLRVLEKYAVRAGGGHNHRFNLADGVLIKDNHIVAAGGISEAVGKVRENIPHTMRVEVETETMEQVAEALEAGADIIMLDNMSVPDMKKAVEFIGGRAITEASGNMGDRDLRQVALTGVDIISIGALTNAANTLDISLKFYE